IESKRFLIVPLDSSAARMPLPAATSACAISSSDVVWMAICPPRLSVSHLALSPCGYRGLDRNVQRRPNGVKEEQDHVQQDRARWRAEGAPGAEAREEEGGQDRQGARRRGSAAPAVRAGIGGGLAPEPLSGARRARRGGEGRSPSLERPACRKTCDPSVPL